MTKDKKFKIGLALTNIALALDSENYEKIRSFVESISEIVLEEPEESDDE